MSMAAKLARESILYTRGRGACLLFHPPREMLLMYASLFLKQNTPFLILSEKKIKFQYIRVLFKPDNQEKINE
jgi:hypothetical protein